MGGREGISVMCDKCLNAFKRPRWHFPGRKKVGTPKYRLRKTDPNVGALLNRLLSSMSGHTRKLFTAMFGHGGRVVK